MAWDICVSDEESRGGEGGNAATDEIGLRIVVLGRSMIFHKKSFQLLRAPPRGSGALCVVFINKDGSYPSSRTRVTICP